MRHAQTSSIVTDVQAVQHARTSKTTSDLSLGYWCGFIVGVTSTVSALGIVVLASQLLRYLVSH